MLKKILQWLTNYLADILNKVIAGVILLCLSASALVVWSRNLLQTPIQLWIVILISLSILFCCAILFLIYSRNSSSAPAYKIKYFTVNNQKWKVKIFDSGYFEVDYNPICPTHDLPFVSGTSFLACPEFVNKKCDNFILHKDHHITYKVAESYIDKKIRNKETL